MLSIQQLKQLISLQETARVDIIQIGVSGYADRQGTRLANQELSEQRAKLVANMLLANHIDENLIVSWGFGVKDLATVPSDLQRRVSIQILSQSQTGESP